MSNDLYVIANKSFDVEKNLTIENLFTTNPLIYREQGSATRSAMEQFLDKNNMLRIKKIELTSNEAVKQAVLAGLGISVMPIIGIKNELASGDLKIISLPAFPIISAWNLIWLKNKKFSPVAQKYFDYLTENKNKLIDKNFGWIATIHK